MGVGKSRIVAHSNREIEHKLQTTNPTFDLPKTNGEISFNDAFGHVGHIFIDFSRGDQYSDCEKDLDTSTSLGLRIAAHFFFGVGFDALMDKLLDMEQRKQFTFGNVCSLISKRYVTNKQVLLTIQFDEFQKLPKEERKENDIVNKIISLLGTHVTSEHDLGVCILAQLTGTDTIVEIKEIDNSRLIPTLLLLEPLETGQEIKLCQIELG